MNSDGRVNIISLYVGMRGTGKTDYIKGMMDSFPQPKTLICDILDNPVWHNMQTWDHPEWINRTIPKIPLELVPKHMTGTYRTFSSDIDYMEDIIANHVRNTAVILEDCSRWFDERKLTRKQKIYLLNTKQVNVDMHMFFHNLSSIPPDLVKYADWITIFKTGEEVYYKPKYYHKGFEQAFKTVFESTDEHINRTISLR